MKRQLSCLLFKKKLKRYFKEGRPNKGSIATFFLQCLNGETRFL